MLIMLHKSIGTVRDCLYGDTRVIEGDIGISKSYIRIA